jgi:hypothetical protein
MRLPRVRITVWRMMVVVAVVGVMLSYQKHWSDYQRLAKDHQFGLCGFGMKDPVQSKRMVGLMVYHNALRRKYELTSWMPWIAFSPDPPPP